MQKGSKLFIANQLQQVYLLLSLTINKDKMHAEN